MANYKKLVLFAFAFLMHRFAMAQSSVPPNEGGFMRSEGKIYVVMAVVLTILTGLLVYIIRLDRKISRLEKGSL